MFNFFSNRKKKQGKNKKSKEAALKEKAVISVMKKTGWDYNYASQKIMEAGERVGISPDVYDKNDFFRFPESEQELRYRGILARKERNRLTRENTIESAMQKTGWDRNHAVEQINETRKNTGITYREYEKYNFCMIPAEDHKQRYNEILMDKKRKKKESRQKIISEVAKITGWSEETAKEKIKLARAHTGCAYKEYLIYKFYDLDEDVQKDVFKICDSKKIAEKYDVNNKFITMLCNKELTNSCFSKYMKRPWCVNTKISMDTFIELFSNSERIIYKPLDGNRGRGVEAFDISEENAQEVYEMISGFPEGVVEQYVVQHHELSDLAPSSVNTVRIVSVSSETQPVTNDGKHMDIAYAALRIGGGESIVDNFHSGGMVAAIDPENGKLVTDAADMQGNVFSRHPLTGKTIKGFTVPFFSEAVDMVKQAYQESHIEGYIGWDIAITETGPVLIEINLRPGAVLLSMPYISEKKGMKKVMEKYL